MRGSLALFVASESFLPAHQPVVENKETSSSVYVKTPDSLFPIAFMIATGTSNVSEASLNICSSDADFVSIKRTGINVVEGEGVVVGGGMKAKSFSSVPWENTMINTRRTITATTTITIHP